MTSSSSDSPDRDPQWRDGVIESQVNKTHALDKRITTIEEQIKHLASTNDLWKLKMWVGIGGGGTVTSIIFFFIKYIVPFLEK